MTDCGRVVRIWSSPLIPPLQKPRRMSGRNAVPQHPGVLVLEPFAEGCGEHKVKHDVISLVSLLSQPASKGPKVCRDGSFWASWSQSQQDKLIVDAVSHG